MSSLLNWIEKHPALAAWVQAVAIIVAIAGTWLAGWLLQRTERRMERRTLAKAVSEIAVAAEEQVRRVVSELPDREAVSAIATGEKSFDIRAIDELEAAIAAIQLHNLSTPELVRDVIALLANIRQLRERLAHAIATHHRMDAAHFSELLDTLTKVHAAIIQISASIATHVSQI
ncbi:hypothetical protein LMG19083_04268 [Ralstonia psammae]|uniref:Transmembrane protein n=1 Tax=Ralstonia psammae TaxID=3058598 RepID=A0ABM9JWI4_9RALS|nr:hypothetical protein [Ralstonia sp. LMG 19083]CAJ0805641.1 hypothetical protein LMG19083_04268 [Ralstonia sp. LMG 19083]